MSELYWLTRLDGLHEFFIALICFSTFGAGILILALLLEGLIDRKAAIKYLKRDIPFIVIGLVGCLFVPTSKEAMVIYGVGGTIEYLKENDKAKQLPDKCIDALDKLIKDYTEK